MLGHALLIAVLGILPFVREMLRMGCEVVMVANTLPAINDITAAELRRWVGGHPCEAWAEGPHQAWGE